MRVTLCSIILIPFSCFASTSFDPAGISKALEIDFSSATKLRAPENKEFENKLKALAQDFLTQKNAYRGANATVFAGIGDTLNPIKGNENYKYYFRFLVRSTDLKSTYICQGITDRDILRYSAGCYGLMP